MAPHEVPRPPFSTRRGVEPSISPSRRVSETSPTQLRMPLDLKKTWETVQFPSKPAGISSASMTTTTTTSENKSGGRGSELKSAGVGSTGLKRTRSRVLSGQDLVPTWIFHEANDPNHTCENSDIDHVCIVSARLHQHRLSKTCSWLHQYEHARALHQGLSEGSIHWPDYSKKTDPPNLKRMVEHLQSLAMKANLPRRFETPKESLWSQIPEIESHKEIEAAFTLSTIQFTGEMTLDLCGKPSVRLRPAQIAMGSNLFRRYGSDRFFRLKLDKTVTHAAIAQISDRNDPSKPKTRTDIQTFFHHPMTIFGRRYEPFCMKDSAMIYWCSSGPKIETISLIQFCQNYIDINLNHSMTVAKYTARFELGLTPTTPTIVFPRSHVLRVPDILSDSLTMSCEMMKKVYQDLRRVDSKTKDESENLPEGYIPSAIRGAFLWTDSKTSVEQAKEMVWRLDFSTCPHIEEFRSASTTRSASKSLAVQMWRIENAGSIRLRFDIKKKDGGQISTEVSSDSCKIDFVEGAAVEKGVVMTDGCGLVSLAAMRQIAFKLAETSGDAGLLRGLPPAVQGRLGPGKGVWAVAPSSPWGIEANFIEVRDSQWKFEDAQSKKFIFELHSIPSARDSAKLGKQTFEVLAHCGVPTGVFRALLKEQLKSICDPFYDFTDLGKLLYHIEKSTQVHELSLNTMKAALDPTSIRERSWRSDDAEDYPSGDEEDGTDAGPSSTPTTILECVVEMLRAGLSPDGSQPGSCPPLGAKVDRIAFEQIRKNTSFRFSSAQCRTALVVADHLGVLEEGEIFFQASEAISNQGKLSNIVIGDVLVTRPPAVQPCDVQRFKAVFHPEFREVYDLVVMPIKGSRPACSILSGGDYDGDKVLIITDPSLVVAFDPTRADPSFADPPFADPDYFCVENRRVGSSPISESIIDEDSSTLSRTMISGLFHDARFGQLSKIHTKLSYALGLGHPTTRLFGHLFARALDGKKQGLTIDNTKWAKIQNLLPTNLLPPEWPERDEGRLNVDLSHLKFAIRPKKLGKHVMDELMKEGRKAIDEAPQKWREVSKGWKATIDDDLANFWRNEWEEAKRNGDRDDAFYKDLSAILAHVKAIWQYYQLMRSAWQRQKEEKATLQKAYRGPGSPSPNKEVGGWKSSSKGQKEDLVICATKLWSILDAETFVSERLRGVEGLKLARALIASCCYIEPLMPEPSNSPTSLLERFRLAAADSAPTPPAQASPISIERAFAFEPAEPMEGIEQPYELSQSQFEDSFLGSQTDWSEIDRFTTNPLTRTETRTTTTSISATSLLVPSQASAGGTSTTSASNEEVSSVIATHRKFYSPEFRDAGNAYKWTFVYDMCHRDILGIKTDAISARASSANGDSWISARERGVAGMKVTNEMLNVMSVNKSLVGMSKVKEIKRPRTFLEEKGPPDDERLAKKLKE